MKRVRAFLSWWTARPDRWMVALLVALTLAKGMLWIGVYPMWKIADEPAHFDNITYRAENSLRAPRSNGTPLEKVMSQTTSIEMRLSWSAAQIHHREKHSEYFSSLPDEPKLALLAKDKNNRVTSGQMPALMYPGLYYSLGTIPYLMLQEKSIINRLYAVRLVSLLFGLMAVLATYFAARMIFDAPELAFATACAVCLQPMFSQMTAAVNNDAAVIGTCALAFAVQVGLLRRTGPPRLVEGLLLGFVVSLCVLSKPQGWLMVLTSFAVMGWVTLSSGRAAWRMWAGGAVGFAVLLIFASLWPAAEFPVSPVHVAAVKPVLQQAKDSPLSLFIGELTDFPRWVDELDEDYRQYLLRSAFGQFSWLEFSLPGYWMQTIKDIVPFCVIGLLLAAIARIVVPPAQRLFWAAPPVLLAAATAFLGVASILFVEYHTRNNHIASHVIQGRNFLFLLPEFAVLVVVGLGSMVPAKFRGLTAALLVTVSMAVNVGALLCIVRNHYGG